jgi:D-3-phosphoglycerate dehydrogenase
MLNGRTLGLIGCGRIGGWMSRYATAFGMRVLAYDPHAASLPEGVSRATLDGLMAECDVVSIHVHLSDETRGLVSRSLLESAKRGMILINTSRGAVVDEAALLDGLRSGRIGAAGLDVIAGEPDIANDPLVAYARSNSNLLITPHCGGFSPDAVRVVCRRAAEKIATALSG